ncbi:MAG: YabP/YqfC family sporulation protein [Clostridia bacterium]|nr:YabP/YqfC family sporulation protein [Clostridia bacterium]
MSLINEIDGYVGKNFDITLNEYRYVNIGGKSLYIEAHKGIQLLSNEEITFKLKKKIISIKGHDLFVKYIDNSTAVIFGTIVQVNVL